MDGVRHFSLAVRALDIALRQPVGVEAGSMEAEGLEAACQCAVCRLCGDVAYCADEWHLAVAVKTQLPKSS